ncbi:hypothetical protein P7C73_g2558, partial [Tremellales sp. Uapishka_1]
MQEAMNALGPASFLPRSYSMPGTIPLNIQTSAPVPLDSISSRPSAQTVVSPPAIVATPWVQSPHHPYFLPPATSAPPPMVLLGDTLELAKEYREFVEGIAKLHDGFGKSLTAAVKKFETKLIITTTGQPGVIQQKPTSTLHSALLHHMSSLQTLAARHLKYAADMTDQLVDPLNVLERKEGEVVRKMGTWAREIGTRWDSGLGVVEKKAKEKYHAAYINHQTSVQKLRSLPAPASPPLPPPSSDISPHPPPYPPTRAQMEWKKLEKAVEDNTRICLEKKNEYVIAVAGMGRTGGGAQGKQE